MTATPLLSTPSPTVEMIFAPFETSTGQTETVSPTEIKGTPWPLATATLTMAPKMTSDLLYITNQKLMRWDHVTNFSVPLVEGVSEYSASQDGSQVLLLRPTGVAANGVDLFNLDVLDMQTKQITNILKGIPRLESFVISPNGDWVVIQESIGQKYALTAFPLNQPDQRNRLGDCVTVPQKPCQVVMWNPGNHAVLWEDERGIWLANLDKNAFDLLTSHKIEVTDPKGQKSQLFVQFQGLSWSRDGRYLLAEVSTPANICWVALFDIYQHRWTEIPDSFTNYCPARAGASWTDSGDLLVIKPSISPESQSVLIDLYQVVPTMDGLFNLVQENELTDLKIESAHTNTSKNPLSILWPAKIGPHSVGFGIGSASSPNDDLITADLDTDSITQLSTIQEKVNTIKWSPDGTGALVLTEAGKLLFLPVSGEAPIELQVLPGNVPFHFTWMAPTSRN